MGKLRNYVWLRWTLLCEYPEEFLIMPALLLVLGLILVGVGMMISNPLVLIVLVYSGYATGLIAVITFAVSMVLLRPDNDDR